ncbi:MAG: sulfotransferase domain-containing protein [Actinomycetota bacterium]|nr:sulfotransferase domain-containing protein [Actinomycetota bacterium]
MRGESAPLDVIHVGYPKTATTTLQKALFVEHPLINYVGRPYKSSEVWPALDLLRRVDDVFFDPADTRDRVCSAAAGTGGVSLLSEERLTAGDALGPGTVARRLHDAFPDASIVITIRNQIDVVPSWYVETGRFLHDVPRPYANKHVTLTNWLEHLMSIYPRGVLGTLQYGSVVQRYDELFGDDRVHVLMFEQLAQDPRAFADRLARIIHLDPDDCFGYLQNQHRRGRRTERFVRYQTLRQRVLPATSLHKVPGASWARDRLHGWLFKGKEQRVELDDVWEAELRRLFAQSNALLAAREALPLREHGYPLPVAQPDRHTPESSSTPAAEGRANV